jgi:hypothetical protein
MPNPFESRRAYELRVAQALADAGGPVELASQLCAIAAEAGLPDQKLLDFIRFHAAEWEASNFRRWVARYQEASRAIDARKGDTK